MKNYILFLFVFLIGCTTETLQHVTFASCDNKISTPLFEGHGQTPLAEMEDQADQLPDVYTRICNPDSVLYLTFDDGPSKYTGEILNVLAAYKVEATFFVVGTEAKKYPQLLKDELREGHTIGNHTYDHAHLVDSNYVSEIQKGNEAIKAVIGQYPECFRAPWGKISNSNWKKIHEAIPNYTLYHWSLNTEDWRWNRHGEPEDIVRAVKKYAKSGDIILMHDGGGNRSKTVAALPQIIEYLQKCGYKLKAL